MQLNVCQAKLGQMMCQTNIKSEGDFSSDDTLKSNQIEQQCTLFIEFLSSQNVALNAFQPVFCSVGNSVGGWRLEGSNA